MKSDKKDSVNPAGMGDYELDNHVRTMQDAHKIMGDKKLMKAVHKHAKGKLDGLKKITGMLKTGMDDDSEKEATSIDDIRAARKSRKNKMFGNE